MPEIAGCARRFSDTIVPRRRRRPFSPFVINGLCIQAFVFVWRERGGPPVVAPTREGFGSRVIKTSLADDFGGSVELAYEPTGFICTLTAPLENLPRAPASL